MIKEIRAQAKRMYKGNILLFCVYLAVCIMMIFCINLLPLVYEELVSYSFGYMQWEYAGQLDFSVAVVIAILSAFVFYSLSSSVTRCFMKTAAGERIGVDDVFYYFAPLRAFENFGLRISLTFIKIVALLFFITPFTLCVRVLIYLLSASVSLQISIIIAAVSVVFLAVGIIFYRRFSCLLFLCPFMMCTDGKTGIKSMVETSGRIMKDKSCVIRKIRMSFAGYFVLCVLVFPVGYVWVCYRQTLTVLAQKFIKEYA